MTERTSSHTLTDLVHSTAANSVRSNTEESHSERAHVHWQEVNEARDYESKEKGGTDDKETQNINHSECIGRHSCTSYVHMQTNNTTNTRYTQCRTDDHDHEWCVKNQHEKRDVFRRKHLKHSRDGRKHCELWNFEFCTSWFYTNLLGRKCWCRKDWTFTRSELTFSKVWKFLESSVASLHPAAKVHIPKELISWSWWTFHLISPILCSFIGEFITQRAAVCIK